MDAIRPRVPAARGQHFLAPRLAADLVRNAGITRGDLVVEIGAGTGVITRQLARRAGRVIAVELDPRFASRLRKQYASARNVQVVGADALRVPLPRKPYRVVGNLPFARTTAILRRLLDDPSGALMRADLVVQWGVAVKRCSQRPSTLLTISWSPWFELTITRRLAASSFRPPPPVDAAVMAVTRRPDPLLDVSECAAFHRFLRREFARYRDATDLDGWEWTEIFRRGRRRRASGRRP